MSLEDVISQSCHYAVMDPSTALIGEWFVFRRNLAYTPKRLPVYLNKDGKKVYSVVIYRNRAQSNHAIPPHWLMHVPSPLKVEQIWSCEFIEQEGCDANYELAEYEAMKQLTIMFRLATWNHEQVFAWNKFRFMKDRRQKLYVEVMLGFGPSYVKLDLDLFLQRFQHWPLFNYNHTPCFVLDPKMLQPVLCQTGTVKDQDVCRDVYEFISRLESAHSPCFGDIANDVMVSVGASVIDTKPDDLFLTRLSFVNKDGKDCRLANIKSHTYDETEHSVVVHHCALSRPQRFDIFRDFGCMSEPIAAHEAILFAFDERPVVKILEETSAGCEMKKLTRQYITLAMDAPSVVYHCSDPSTCLICKKNQTLVGFRLAFILNVHALSTKNQIEWKKHGSPVFRYSYSTYFNPRSNQVELTVTDDELKMKAGDMWIAMESLKHHIVSQLNGTIALQINPLVPVMCPKCLLHGVFADSLRQHSLCEICINGQYLLMWLRGPMKIFIDFFELKPVDKENVSAMLLNSARFQMHNDNALILPSRLTREQCLEAVLSWKNYAEGKDGQGDLRIWPGSNGMIMVCLNAQQQDLDTVKRNIEQWITRANECIFAAKNVPMIATIHRVCPFI